MKQDVSRTKEFRKYYLSEFELYDGEEFITFSIVHIDTEKKVLQCYGDHDSKPTEEILDFVHKKWLPYANRQIKQIAAA